MKWPIEHTLCQCPFLADLGKSFGRTRMMKREPIRSPSFPTLEGPQGSSSSPPSTTGSTPSADMVLELKFEGEKESDAE